MCRPRRSSIPLGLRSLASAFVMTSCNNFFISASERILAIRLLHELDRSNLNLCQAIVVETAARGSTSQVPERSSLFFQQFQIGIEIVKFRARVLELTRCVSPEDDVNFEPVGFQVLN